MRDNRIEYQESKNSRSPSHERRKTKTSEVMTNAKDLTYARKPTAADIEKCDTDLANRTHKGLLNQRAISICQKKEYLCNPLLLFCSTERKIIRNDKQPLCKYLFDPTILLNTLSNFNVADIESEC